MDALREKNALLDERNKLLVATDSYPADCPVHLCRDNTMGTCSDFHRLCRQHVAITTGTHAAEHAASRLCESAAVQHISANAFSCRLALPLAVTIEPAPTQDKYLELAPEPLHIDEWWIDPRTRAALEGSVGLGDHVTFTADQTRPLQLTRSQVRAGFQHAAGIWTCSAPSCPCS